MSSVYKKEKTASLLPLLNDLSDQSFSSIPFADDDSVGASCTTKSVSGRIGLNGSTDLSILVHLSDSDREQSDSKLYKKNSRYPAYLPGFIIKVHNIAGSLKRNSISLPTGLDERTLDALRFPSHIPDGGRELENITKSCEKETVS